MNNSSCNQPKVVPEPEIPVPRCKEQWGGVADIRAAGSMDAFMHVHSHKFSLFCIDTKSYTQYNWMYGAYLYAKAVWFGIVMSYNEKGRKIQNI